MEKYDGVNGGFRETMRIFQLGLLDGKSDAI